MKLGHEFYPFEYLKRNQKCSVFLKKPENLGKFAPIRILHANDRLASVHEGCGVACREASGGAAGHRDLQDKMGEEGACHGPRDGDQI